MDKTEEIIEYLRNSYKPSAILLHGSRAVGRERLHSDWDIILLFENDLPSTKDREEVAGESVEWKAYKLPIADEKIFETFDVYLQFAKVLWEENDHGNTLLKRAGDVYEKGPNPYSLEEIEKEKLFFTHKIDGLEDDKEVPYLFLRHQCVLRTQAMRLWFEMLNKKYSQPLYIAMPLIEKEDSEFYKNMILFTSFEASPEEKVAVAKQMFKLLFKK